MKHLWPIRLIWVLLRNQIWLKPHAWSAHRHIRALVSAAGFKLESSELQLGLTEAQDLELALIFQSDKDLACIQASSLPADLLGEFRQQLATSGYPASAAAKAIVTLHSSEEIARCGGYYQYFK